MSHITNMMEKSARVIEVKEGFLMAETESLSSCSHCSSGDSCSTSVIAKLFGNRRNRLVVENSLQAKPGDQVLIGIPDQLLVRASVMAYLLPLITMLGVTLLGDVLGVDDFFLSLLALMGLAVGFYMVRWATRRAPSLQRYKPRLLRIVAAGYQRVEMPNLTRS